MSHLVARGMSQEQYGYALRQTTLAEHDQVTGPPGADAGVTQEGAAMRGKLWFLGGAAVGFVLGARAGREKYDELVLQARKLWDHPTVQEAAGVVQAQANRLYHEGKDTVSDKLSHTKIGEKLTSGSTGDDPLATTSATRSTASDATASARSKSSNTNNTTL
jgi:hypothetical protein